MAGKFLRRMRGHGAVGRLDVCGGLWQYSPPRLAGVIHLHSKQAADLRHRTESRMVGTLSQGL
ncbi:hypothetical protein ACFY2M_13225 [Streptomyces sp. NPDC001276]|uniref:hypothetical protein n=1 Tax=Streptomyces sp. NPDC001276 TaxID=3364555 RepID=UPI0036833E4E